MAETRRIDAHVYRLYGQDSDPVRPFVLCVQELSDQPDGSTQHRHEDFEIAREELMALAGIVNELLSKL